MPPDSTRERILDAAEGLFADEGFSTSLRSITATAAVNLAAVNYHFGSKDGLIEQVFSRRLAPLNAERLEALDAVERDAANETPPPLEPIVRCFIAPAIRLSRDPQGATFMRLVGHTLGRRDDRLLSLFADQFKEVVVRFHRAIGRALPGLDSPDVFWRMLFMIGSMAHTMSLGDKIPYISGGICRPAPIDEMVDRLVDFAVAGIRGTRAGETSDKP